MVALGLFGCIEAARRFEVNIKLCALFFCEVIKGFILLMQRNLAFHDFFRKIGGFEFICNRRCLRRMNFIRMNTCIQFVACR